MKAQQQGWNDFFDSRDVNPHPPGTTKRTYWKRGWEKARKHWDLPLDYRSYKAP